MVFVFNFSVFVSMSFQYQLWRRIWITVRSKLFFSKRQVLVITKVNFFSCWKSCLKLNVGLNEDVERLFSIYMHLWISESFMQVWITVHRKHVDLSIFASQGCLQCTILRKSLASEDEIHRRNFGRLLDKHLQRLSYCIQCDHFLFFKWWCGYIM